MTILYLVVKHVGLRNVWFEEHVEKIGPSASQ